MITCNVRRLIPEDLPSLAAILNASPFMPYAGHASWPQQKLSALFLARAADIIRGRQSTTWLAECNSGIVGMAVLIELPWDTRQIGMPSSRLDYFVAMGSYAEQCRIKEALLTEALRHSATRGIQHLNARVSASDLSSLHTLECTGFATVGGILTYALNLHDGSIPRVNGEIRTRLARAIDVDALRAIARSAYKHDRFHADPSIPQSSADEVYAEWVRNCYHGIEADAVIVAEDEQALLGFVTCKLQRDTLIHLGKLVGTIVLVATAEEARNRGVARAATLAALDWFRQQGVGIVEVGTQLSNTIASRLYEGCGFRLVDSTISLRAVLPQDTVA